MRSLLIKLENSVHGGLARRLESSRTFSNITNKMRLQLTSLLSDYSDSDYTSYALTTRPRRTQTSAMYLRETHEYEHTELKIASQRAQQNR